MLFHPQIKCQYVACYIIVQVTDIYYIKNNKGSNGDPCGTPLKSDFQFEISPSTTISCLLSVSHFSIQFIMPSLCSTRKVILRFIFCIHTVGYVKAYIVVIHRNCRLDGERSAHRHP